MDMQRTPAICLVIMLAACGTRLAPAQNPPRQARDASPVAREDKSEASSHAKMETTASPPGSNPERSKTLQPYSLDFALNELQDGNKTNTRHYSMDLTAGKGSGDEIKIGTRVPVPVGPGGGNQFQYMDVGTSIWAALRESGGDDCQLEVRSEISDLDASPKKEQSGEIRPIVRQMTISGTTLLVTGKPIVIGTLDDPNSKRQFQLEVTATRLR
jgi:hypothetical protein